MSKEEEHVEHQNRQPQDENWWKLKEHKFPKIIFFKDLDLTRFSKITIQGTPQMAVDKEAIICLPRVYSYYYNCNLALFYV